MISFYCTHRNKSGREAEDIASPSGFFSAFLNGKTGRVSIKNIESPSTCGRPLLIRDAVLTCRGGRASQPRFSKKTTPYRIPEAQREVFRTNTFAPHPPIPGSQPSEKMNASLQIGPLFRLMDRPSPRNFSDASRRNTEEDEEGRKKKKWQRNEVGNRGSERERRVTYDLSRNNNKAYHFYFLPFHFADEKFLPHSFLCLLRVFWPFALLGSNRV
ncbi:hypothetical protein CEXT_492141 [Caerostris extrusa]|uniref:Uncharacterized protein n=1 Tax=Caerostris extrusa TaxID=172846 RepID=A0AAV4XXM6_CAEEX|nr:hypothetical protein CEXT_492141 [Caerostris extrusa]